MHIKWDSEPRAAFRAALHYIRQRSEQNAEKVFERVEAAIAALPTFPYRHRADPLCIANDGSYRYFVIYHYRISYRVLEAEGVIQIVRFRHTSQQPQLY